MWQRLFLLQWHMLLQCFCSLRHPYSPKCFVTPMTKVSISYDTVPHWPLTLLTTYSLYIVRISRSPLPWIIKKYLRQSYLIILTKLLKLKKFLQIMKRFVGRLKYMLSGVFTIYAVFFYLNILSLSYYDQNLGLRSFRFFHQPIMHWLPKYYNYKIWLNDQVKGCKLCL